VRSSSSSRRPVSGLPAPCSRRPIGGFRAPSPGWQLLRCVSCDMSSRRAAGRGVEARFGAERALTREADLVGVSTRKATRKRYACEGRESTPKHNMLWSDPGTDRYMLGMWTRRWETGGPRVGDRWGHCGRPGRDCGSAVRECLAWRLVHAASVDSFAHLFYSLAAHRPVPKFANFSCPERAAAIEATRMGIETWAPTARKLLVRGYLPTAWSERASGRRDRANRRGTAPRAPEVRIWRTCWPETTL
jgi:hypothetical protein